MDYDFFESLGQDPELEAEILSVLKIQPPTPGLETAETLGGVLGDPTLEAIVKKTGRPSLLIWQGIYEEPKLDLWRARLDNARDDIQKAIAATGRIEIKGRQTHVGTAWLIRDNIAVTNRHVASIFAQPRNGLFEIVRDSSGQSATVVVDFLSELDNPNSREARVTDVLYIASKYAGEPDVAFLVLDETADLPEPARLGDDTELTKHPDDALATIGYPAFDSRNNADDQQRIFGGSYNVKRLAPGLVQDLRPSTIAHDCTTLGGNSGSMVLSLKQGGAVGLHFSGAEGDENRAVRISKVVELLDRALGGELDGAGNGAAGDTEVEAPKPVLNGRGGYVSDGFLGDGVVVPAPQPIGAESVLTALKSSDGDDSPQFELKYHNFSSWMHKDRRLPALTAVNIDGTVAKGVKRANDRWFTDDRIEEHEQIGNELYKGNALDRGHLVRRLDPAWGELSEEAVIDTFHYTNCAPQHEALNRREWLALEDHILESSKTHGFKACVFTGPIFSNDDPTYRGVQLPQAFWKIVATLHTSDDESEPALATSAYVLSQEELLVGIGLEFAFGEFRTFQAPISRVSKLANLAVHPNLVAADTMKGDEEGLGYRTIWTLDDVLV